MLANKIIKIKNFYKNIQILNKFSFFYILKNTICLTLFLFIIVIFNDLYKNYIGNKIIIIDKDNLIFDKNLIKVNNEDLSFNIKFKYYCTCLQYRKMDKRMYV